MQKLPFMMARSEDLGSLDRHDSRDWPLEASALCQVAMEEGLLKQAPIVFIDKQIVLPVNPEHMTEEACEDIADALQSAWEGENGIEVILEGGRRRTFKYKFCKCRDVDLSSIYADYREGEKIISMDVLTMSFFGDTDLDGFLEAFFALFPFAGQHLEKTTLRAADGSVVRNVRPLLEKARRRAQSIASSRQ